MKTTIITKDLLALAYIGTNFSDFDQNMRTFIQENCKSQDQYFSFINKLVRLMEGKSVFPGKVKRFYQENKMVLDEIARYSFNGSTFLRNYDFDGISDTLQTFYQYFLEHEKDMEQIVAVIERICKLGINRIFYDETADFTKKTYCVYSKLGFNYLLHYVDNMEAVPNCSNFQTFYKTTNSPYEIECQCHSNNRIYENLRSIRVNSLAFDPERLPKQIDKETCFDSILALPQVPEDVQALRNSVCLNTGVHDLYEQYCRTYESLSKLENVGTRQLIMETLIEIKDRILNLDTLSREYADNSASETLPLELIQGEQKRYLQHREFIDKMD